MSVHRRMHNEPGFLLHTYPYRETSVIAEIWTRNYGRLSVVAKGARRPYSSLRGALLVFQPLLLGWSGKSEIKTLIQAEWQGGQAWLSGRALLCAYYLNELLLRFTPKEDAQTVLFDSYRQALHSLAQGSGLSATLRRFELCLLREIGYAPLFTQSILGVKIEQDAYYAYKPESGFELCDRVSTVKSPVVLGRTLKALSEDDFSNPQIVYEAKILLRALMEPYLGSKPLEARRVLTDIMEFE